MLAGEHMRTGRPRWGGSGQTVSGAGMGVPSGPRTYRATNTDSTRWGSRAHTAPRPHSRARARAWMWATGSGAHVVGMSSSGPVAYQRTSYHPPGFRGARWGQRRPATCASAARACASIRSCRSHAAVQSTSD